MIKFHYHLFQNIIRCHVYSTESEEDLLEWARTFKIPRSWMHYSNEGLPHFDLWGDKLKSVSPPRAGVSNKVLAEDIRIFLKGRKMKNEVVWITGKFNGETKDGIIWNLRGIFHNEKDAKDLCIDETYFIVPIEVDRAISIETVDEIMLDETIELPGCYYPLASKNDEAEQCELCRRENISEIIYEDTEFWITYCKLHPDQVLIVSQRHESEFTSCQKEWIKYFVKTRWKKATIRWKMRAYKDHAHCYVVPEEV